MAFNKVILIGNITKDVELKQTQSGTSVCSFDIAVNRKINKDEVDFITIVAWRQQAEFVWKYFKKGQAILVCGQIQTRSYTDKQGNKRTAVEVVADEVSFVGNRDTSPTAGASPSGADKGNGGYGYVPTAYSTQNSQNFEAIPNEEGLPF